MWTAMQMAVVMSVALAGAQFAVAAEKDPYDGWKPHAYCNDLDHIEETKIQPLTAEQADRVASLEQVQLVARHGARVPYARVFCWDGAGHNPVNAKWSCSTSSVSSQDIGFKSDSGYGRLYGKKYLDYNNILKGSCVVGALLPEGREQHHINGKLLRDAYVGEDDLKLFSSDDLASIPSGAIYLRSDDQERTVGSGQALVDGLFPPDGSNPALDSMLTWHVSDMATDYINSNDRICPLMGFIANESAGSADFQRHINDPATVKVEKDFGNLVGNFSWDSILECLSIARCNNLDLPKGVDEELFTKVFGEVEARQGLFLTFNNSWYAKVAMQPLVSELLSRMDPIINGSATTPRLAITMGHDSTIMPLMAAVVRENWDRKWTPYAGIFTIELYKTKSNSHAVRVLFKGEPVKLPECKDTLCDIDDFQKAVEFARTPRDCEAPALPTSLSSEHHSFSASQYLSTFILLGLVGLCVLLGIRSRRSNDRFREERSVLLA
ncbi:hypothetical protein Poli38472_006692 [Pythium oligandrum]|uniref:Acid phosphatase n=1 Tax=Pythium oligandrum TaxID=41045 RepID=A0A8K1C5Z6_PYTOL|nr:hypothetical protein Poli38472_006692 [Pythium oligandrum]|eukprot:TMW56682.1 hypothetical protein Poli38472_006692 [Pythium oligandrum]